MVTGLLSVEHTQVLQAQLPAQRDVVLPLSGSRLQRVAAADAGACERTATIWLRAPPHPAHPGGLAGGSQPSSSAVQARGTAGAYESQAPQAHQPAPRTDTDRHGWRSVLGNGFCP